MGGSTSHLLQQELYAQPANYPVVATSPNHCYREPMKLRIMRRKTFSSERSVRETVTNQEIFHFVDPAFSSTTTIMTPGEIPVVALKSRTFHRQYRVLPHRDAEQELFCITYNSQGVAADFCNVVTKQRTRVLLHRQHGWSDRVMVIYLEVDGTRQAIARTYKTKAELFEHRDEFVEVAPGVDVVLVLMLWQVLEDRREQQRRSNASS
ncbi:hypothetical protein PINS_up017766 [Pythium insidiosum]|nr:hypothetical protein PINS_up017327 [Pythium insidiosum]GLE07455.1 hypothetical protein PINS_up017766 [Pythium insidiosum]